MKMDSKIALFAAALGAAVVGSSTLATSSASGAASCAGATYLCFYDFESAQYGNVSGDNNWWGAFGWNDRADAFKNDGTQMNVCLYQDINLGGWTYFVPRHAGWFYPAANAVSSNRWTDAGNAGGCR